MKRDLPLEHSEHLDFESLLGTLRLLEGEQVVFVLSLGRVARMEARGIVRLYVYGDVGTGIAIDPDARIVLTDGARKHPRRQRLLHDRDSIGRYRLPHRRPRSARDRHLRAGGLRARNRLSMALCDSARRA